MLTAALLLSLTTIPRVDHAFLLREHPSAVRLVDAEEEAMPAYETWTRVRLRTEYDRLEDLRPGIALPVSMILFGLTDAVICTGWLVSGLSSFFGIEVAAAAALAVAIVIGVGLAIVGTILIVRLWPERRAIGRKMDAIEEVYHGGFWRNQQPQPCPQVPEPGPVGPDSPTGPPPPTYHAPQVLNPEGFPITVAVF